MPPATPDRSPAPAETDPPAETAPAAETDPRTESVPAASRPVLGRRPVLMVCVFVVLAATGARLWVAAAGWFYWDDLILHGLAARHAWPDPDLLFTDHDGHLMPGGMALVWLATHLAPLEFRVPLLQIALLQLVSGAALARMLWVLLSGRTVLLVPLTAALVIPLGLPAATWWAAALNALPLTAAMAWAVASMVLLARTGGAQHAVGAAVATALGLLFVEKAVFVPVVAAVVLLGGWWTTSGTRADLPTLWRRTRAAWLAQSVIVAVWAAVFLVVVGRLGGRGSFGAAEGTRPDFAALVDHTYRLAVAPTLGGGPWRWDRWHPGPPMADPPLAAVIAGAVACAAVLAWSLATRRRTGAIWAGAALYPLVSVVLVAVGRAGPDTAAEIVQTLRYHAELPVVLAAATALALAAPRRANAPRRSPTPRRANAPRPRNDPRRTHNAPTLGGWPAAGALGLVALLASSAVSTVTYRQTWAEQPSRDYVQPLLAALRDRTEPLLDKDLPPEVLLPVTAPAHRLSWLLSGMPGVPEVGAWTREPVVIDAGGTLWSADVVPGRTLPQGPEPGCGHRIGADGTRIELDGPLIGRDWVVRLHTFAEADGHVSVRLDDGEPAIAPVEAGLGTVYVRLVGGGSGLTVSPIGGLSGLCVGSGPVGVLVPR
ncbi:hypothetical protein [Dietzia lutea]|uniref:Glycosyltransferase RgtA/B/C/D-like domain-containing protein n=1 Tax=Dietzia lutea TaxID=546160 RepID=A0A2S1R4W5_9ACTN|nr:hypothetical protein [Dietzia lutea]AWH91284.1 hypothetical protein A6035_02880 [Dietzia lutea]